MYLIEDNLAKLGFTINQPYSALKEKPALVATYKKLITFTISQTSVHSDSYNLKYSIASNNTSVSNKTSRNIQFDNQTQLLAYLNTNVEMMLTNMLSLSLYQLIVSDNEILDETQLVMGLECRISYVQSLMNKLSTNKASRLREIVNNKNTKTDKKLKLYQKNYTNKLFKKLEKLAKSGISHYEFSTNSLTDSYVEELIHNLRFEFFMVDYSVTEMDDKTKIHNIKISW